MSDRPAGQGKTVHPSRRLPDIRLSSMSTGQEVALRPGRRRAPLLILTHGPACAACGEYLAQLQGNREAITEWDGYPLVIVPEFQKDAGEKPTPDLLPVLVDSDRRLSTALGLRVPAVVIADQWGEIHELSEAGEDHVFLPVSEIVTYLRYLSMQCPECQGEAF